MPGPTSPLAAASQDASDLAVAGRIAGGDEVEFERLMRRCNSRLFRVARAILKDDADAEDALQEAYLQAYRRIGEFRGEAQLTTWLTRILVNQALMRARQLKRVGVVVPFSGHDGHAANDTAEVDVADERIEPVTDVLARADMRRLLEQKIDELPAAFRTVFVMREVEELSVDETAACLSIPPATVRTRLFRARALLREDLARDMDNATLEVFGFDGERCDRIVTRVLSAVRAAS